MTDSTHIEASRNGFVRLLDLGTIAFKENSLTFRRPSEDPVEITPGELEVVVLISGYATPGGPPHKPAPWKITQEVLASRPPAAAKTEELASSRKTASYEIQVLD
ncbi:hypothetical protein SeMB42_g06652 [Synchytrium endobioticum]|uniref:Uncharacterized protein n=1 Tax=Synchytrium endobioticum TaxID=286115 RepID=A0A507CGK0_9FUNG|nr:hypothetical protein SeMB42_g06652 [Synchytrium endobioticum]